MAPDASPTRPESRKEYLERALGAKFLNPSAAQDDACVGEAGAFSWNGAIFVPESRSEIDLEYIDTLLEDVCGEIRVSGPIGRMPEEAAELERLHNCAQAGHRIVLTRYIGGRDRAQREARTRRVVVYSDSDCGNHHVRYAFHSY